jgi:signal transduction histidine kinase
MTPSSPGTGREVVMCASPAETEFRILPGTSIIGEFRNSPRHRRNVLLTATIFVSAAVVAYCRLVLHTPILCTHVLYLSLALAGLWWKRKSIWFAVAAAAFVVFLGLISPAREPIHIDLLRGVIFCVVALCVGTVSQRAADAREAERKSRLELQETQQRLAASARLASIGELSAGVAHELNNPLGTILLYSGSLLKETPPDDPRRQDLEMIAAEATRCRKIVQGLLNFARKAEVSKSPTDVRRIVEELLSIMSPAADERSVEFRADIPHDVPLLMADADQIRQMLINLVQNALDAVERGGHVTVTLRNDQTRDALVIAVADDGCGIPEQVQERLFDPFFTTKDPGRGTGLGLAVVYGAVKVHAGDVTVKSDPGRGSVFTVILPLQRDTGYQESVTSPADGTR